MFAVTSPRSVPSSAASGSPAGRPGPSLLLCRSNPAIAAALVLLPELFFPHPQDQTRTCARLLRARPVAALALGQAHTGTSVNAGPDDEIERSRAMPDTESVARLVYPCKVTQPFSFSRAITSEGGVYGLILVAGLIAASGSAGAPAWKTFLFSGVTVSVFWTAHVYAGAVAAHGEVMADGDPKPIRAAIREAIVKSRGLIASTLAPAVALLLGMVGVLPDAVATWTALWVTVTMLGMLGYFAYSRKGARWWVRIVGAFTTASFGVVIILAKAIVTH